MNGVSVLEWIVGADGLDHWIVPGAELTLCRRGVPEDPPRREHEGCPLCVLVIGQVEQFLRSEP